MKLIVNKTAEFESFEDEFELISPETGVNWINDFIGNTGAFDFGLFVWDDDAGVYRPYAPT